MHINEAKRAEYLRNLKAFATVHEALEISGKVIFGMSARLIDPYDSTTGESRERLLTQYPLHHHGILKRAVVFGFTNLGYSEDQDRENMQDLMFSRLKPLEGNLHENNQEFCIKQDSELVQGMLSMTEAPGFAPYYIDGQIVGQNRQLFEHYQKAISQEQPAYDAGYEWLVDSKHIESLVQIGIIVFCPTPYLEGAVESGVLTFDEAALFAKNQCDLIKSEIDKAMLRKNKSEREKTALLKQYLSQYVSFAQSMMIKQNSQGLASEQA